MRFLSLYFYQGNSHSLSRDTKRGFLFGVMIAAWLATRKVEWPVRPTASKTGHGGATQMSAIENAGNERLPKVLTEEALNELLLNASAVPDKTFFDDNYIDRTPTLSDDPTDEERWNNADDACFEVDPNSLVKRMEIRIIRGNQLLGTIYQDAVDGCVYPCEEGGEPYSDKLRKTLIGKDAAFEGDMAAPAGIVGFVEGIPTSEFRCGIAEGEGVDL